MRYHVVHLGPVLRYFSIDRDGNVEFTRFRDLATSFELQGEATVALQRARVVDPEGDFQLMPPPQCPLPAGHEGPATGLHQCGFCGNRGRCSVSQAAETL